jgi:hypothetical protein
MKGRLRIIYILGDGRSGSTLLECIINNDENIISVGECFCFWDRFYRDETLCGCGEQIAHCTFWRAVHERLLVKLKDYDPQQIKAAIKEILRPKNFSQIQAGRLDVDFLLKVIREFYLSLAEVSGKDVIVDSSKWPSWAKLLTMIPDFDVRLVHLERNLPDVAASWKKEKRLPEFTRSNVYMPIKSNISILRSWLSMKYHSGKLNKAQYFFLRYEDLCDQPKDSLKRLHLFLELHQADPLRYKPNHAIAGNPMRTYGEGTIDIQPVAKSKPKTISSFDYFFFKTCYKLVNLFDTLKR